MSEIKDKFYELLRPSLEAKGFEFKRSKEQFIKIENDVHQRLQFRWDGRGGASHLDEIIAIIYSIPVAKAYSKITGLKGDGHNWHLLNGENSTYFVDNQGDIPTIINGQITDWTHTKMYYQIPPMLSPVAQQFFGDMNLRGMKTITFEEKYPIEKIKNCVDKVVKLLDKKLLNFFIEYNLEEKILNSLLNSCKATIEDNHENRFHYSFLAKLYAKKLIVKTDVNFPSDKEIDLNYKNRFSYDKNFNQESITSKIENYKF